MPTPPKHDIISLQAAMVDSLLQPLTPQEAKQVVSAAISAIHCFFLERDQAQDAAITNAMAALSYSSKMDTVNRAGLGHIAMMFPHLTPEMKARLISLVQSDL